VEDRLAEGTSDNQKSANTSLTTDELQHTMPQQHIVDGFEFNSFFVVVESLEDILLVL